MRVAIYAQARSGSTTLLDYISKSLNYKPIFEPFNPVSVNKYSEKEIWHEDNVVVKFLIRTLEKDETEKIKNHFDKVICLTRENIHEGAESHLAAELNDAWKPDKYSFKNSVEINDKNQKRLKDLILYRYIVYEHIKHLPFFQTTYEEIYKNKVGIQKINSYININDEKFLHLLDSKNRYRTDLPEKNLI